MKSKIEIIPFGSILNYDSVLNKLKQNSSVIKAASFNFRPYVEVDVRPMRKKIKLNRGDVIYVSFYDDFMYFSRYQVGRYFILYNNIKNVKITQGHSESASNTKLSWGKLEKNNVTVNTSYVRFTYINNIIESILCENIFIGEDIYNNIKSKIDYLEDNSELNTARSRLQKLKELLEEKLIDDEEYYRRKKEILNDI